MNGKTVRTRCAVLLVGLVACSCAMGNSERRLLLNLLDEHATPGSSAGRWALAPVALPTGLVAGLADAVAIHPATQLDDAWRDTADAVWEFDHGSDFRNVLFTPLAALATPVVFGFTWLGRSVFDIDDHEPEDESEDQPAGAVAKPQGAEEASSEELPEGGR